jgi:putative ABC transport system substrate-binding protein
MNRREVIAGLGSAAAWPVVARAQQASVPVIGYLSPNGPDTLIVSMTAFFEGLKEAGYIEGRNLAVEYHWAEGRSERLPELAADLVKQRVNVIVASGLNAALAAKAATTTIPIVFTTGSDPSKGGLVARLNRPGGNITGVSNFATALAAKRLQLLHQLAPKATSIGVLVDPKTPSSETQKTELQEAAGALSLELHFLNASNEREIDKAFTFVVQRRIGALLLADSTFFNARREQLTTLARFNVVPTMYTFREFAVAGGLISYASSLTDAGRRTGKYVARVLNGEKPGDLPVELATKFELVINLKTAKAIGLEISRDMLSIADEIIE